MRKYLTIIITLLPLFIYGQDSHSLLQQINRAQSFNEMPIIKVVAARDANRIGRKLKDYNTLQQITKGDTLTMYFPIRIYDSGEGIWTRANESYNYIVLEHKMNNNSLIVYQNIMPHLNKEDQGLLRKWLFKYQNLGKALQQKMLEDGTLM
ncbi:MAG: hypothetical protein ACK5M3_11115 [Dysgonomonas sp.]